MGVRLLILLALLIGVLYCLHLLVKDYQALTASRFLRMLFKRDINAQTYSKPHVRWRKILQYDPIQCARYLYCDIGRKSANEVQRGFAFMLTLNPREEDKAAHQEFIKAFSHGRLSNADEEHCKREYPMCPFKASLLFDLIYYLLQHEVK